MRITILGGALIAVVTFTGVLAGQGTAPMVTPMPWYPPGQTADAAIDRIAQASPELRARFEQLLAAVRLPEASTSSARTTSAPTAQAPMGQTSALAGLNECSLPDKTTRPVNAKVTFNGWSYLCVEVLDNQLARHGVGWIRVVD